MTPDEARDFVAKEGIVLESARRGPPNLADGIAGEPIRGSWWGHQAGKAIYHAAGAVRDDPDVLVCRLVDQRITYVHRRLWPALVRLADVLGVDRLSEVRSEHGSDGAHRTIETPYPGWVPDDVAAEAEKLEEGSARSALAALFREP